MRARLAIARILHQLNELSVHLLGSLCEMGPDAQAPPQGRLPVIQMRAMELVRDLADAGFVADEDLDGWLLRRLEDQAEEAEQQELLRQLQADCRRSNKGLQWPPAQASTEWLYRPLVAEWSEAAVAPASDPAGAA